MFFQVDFRGRKDFRAITQWRQKKDSFFSSLLIMGPANNFLSIFGVIVYG